MHFVSFMKVSKVDENGDGLHMMKKGISCTAIAKHFGVSRNTINRIKKAKGRIRMSALYHPASSEDVSNGNKILNI